MTTAEQKGRPDVTPLLDRLAGGADLEPAKDTPDLLGYLEFALKGGYPEAALTLSASIRQRWLESYVDQVLTRDAELIEEGRDPVRLGRYLQACALNTAGVPEHKSLYDAAGINSLRVFCSIRGQGPSDSKTTLQPLQSAPSGPESQ